MRMSHLFGRTLRETPAEAELVSQQLALRAGLVRSLGVGLYAYLPLGWRVVRRIETILREELEALSAQELRMPVLLPAEFGQATGRCEAAGLDLLRVRDRNRREYALGAGYDEAIAELARREVRSYRDLPRMVYQIGGRIRDEVRPRGGLLHAREALVLDAFSLHTDAADLEAFYPQVVAAYGRAFERCGRRTANALHSTRIGMGTWRSTRSAAMQSRPSRCPSIVSIACVPAMGTSLCPKGTKTTRRPPRSAFPGWTLRRGKTN